MSFPVDIERLIIEYSDWLLKYIDKEQPLLSLPEISAAKVALESANPKTMDLRLKLINLIIYSPPYHNLIKQPVVLIFTGENQNQQARIESSHNINDHRGIDCATLNLLQKATKIFVQNWIRCCRTADDWTAIQTAVNEIDQIVQNDIRTWTTEIDQNKENWLKVFIPSNNGSPAGATVGAAAGVIMGALAPLMAQMGGDAQQAEGDNSSGIVMGGFLGAILGYCLDNYHDTMNQYVYNPACNLVSPCWKRLRGTWHSSQTEYANTDVEMQQDLFGELPTFPSLTGYRIFN